MRGFVVPPGYVRLSADGVEGAALASLAEPVREALRDGTLFDYAAHHTEARALTGRGVAWAVPLPDDAARVVVRRSRHGGILARFTGERFLGATRAPRELEISLRLERLGVSTPEVVAYATYPAGQVFRRADVVTREIPDANDLAAMLAASDPGVRRQALAATARLLASLTDAGARHPDLNIKNVLLARDENGELQACVLDVDRVWFDVPGDPSITDANLHRLSRSARKWRRLYGLPVEEVDLLWLAESVREQLGGATE